MCLFLYYFLIKALVSGEVITLLGEESITCVVTQNSLNSAVYIKPPINAEYNHSSLKAPYNDWIYDDWNDTDSIKSYQGPVIDKRWEGLKTQSDARYLELTHFPLSVSVCVINNYFNFSVLCNNHNDIENFIYTEDNKTSRDHSYCQWFHYSLLKRDKNIKFFSNNGEIRHYTAKCSPKWISFGSSFWKLHKYTFKSSDKASLTQRSIVSSKDPCLSMFVSIDKDCYLNITLESNDQIIHKTINGFNEGTFKKWERVEITAASSGIGKLSFFRGHRERKMRGYWAIDNIQACSEDIEIYEITLPPSSSSKYVCDVLSTSHDSPDSTFVCENPGYLENNCHISCNSVLGKSYPNCEGHKICHNDQFCYCPWGYHGKFCAERCNENSWTLNCSSTCKVGCEHCDPVKGCTKCKKNFFGNDCSEMLPVLLNPPVLKSMTENSVTIAIENLEYGENETRPEYYQIQYKSDDDKSFRNYAESVLYGDSLEDEEFLIDNLLTRKWGYQIRIILIVQNQSFVDRVPILLIYKRTLQATVVNDGISLKWKNDSKQNFLNYTIHYKCKEKFCPNKNIRRIYMSTIDTKAKIENLKHWTICHIKLYAKLNKTLKNQLIDQIKVTAATNANIIKTELPRNVTFSTHYTVMELENCEKIRGPLIYHLQYRCLSLWCYNKTIKGTNVTINNYKSPILVDVPSLLPFTTYNLTITATRANATLSQTYAELKTPSAKPQQVQNVSIYCKNSSALWIRWQPPYPPTGVVSNYSISYQKNATVSSYLNDMSSCDLWDNFMCAIITKLKENTSYVVKLSAKNKDFEEWGPPATVAGSTVQKAPGPPENLSVGLFSSTEVILTWAHPFFMNGPLYQFFIQTEENGKIKNYSLNVQNYQKCYDHKISVEYPKEYIVHVWAVNQFEGKKSKITITILPPKAEISSLPFVEACTRKCVLLVPKPKNNQQISFLVTKNKKIVSDENIMETFHLLKNNSHQSEDYWIVNHSSPNGNSNYFQLEIDEKKESAVSVKNRNYSVYLIVNDSENYNHYPMDYKTESDVTYGNIVFLILIIIALLITALLKGYYAHKYETFPSNSEEERMKNDSVGATKIRNFRTLDRPAESTEILPLIKTINNNDEDTNVNSKYVKTDNFEEYLTASLVEDNRENNKLFIQYQKVSRMFQRECKCGQMPKYLFKNRCKDLIAYDITRVILKGDDEGDYINANYIDGYETPKAFIATQAPLPSTIRDFWLMIFQENVSTIIMLTKLVENGNVKCEQYWPDLNERKVRYGKFLIENKSMKICSDYIQRKLQVTCNNQTRFIRHLQYTAWSDYSVPLCLQNFTKFMKNISEIQQIRSSPIVVHCNTGCGRTGILILCDIVLKMAVREKHVNFAKVLTQIRQQRAALVTNVDQYIFAHFVVLECLLEKKFSIPVDNFHKEIEKRPTEATAISLMQDLDKITAVYKRQFNINSFTTQEEKAILSDNYSQIFLPISSSLNISKCINGIYVDGYQFPRRFIVTQQPDHHTVDNFWKLINGHKIATVVSLNTTDEDNYNSPRLWPNSNYVLWRLNDSMSLHFISETDNKFYKTINLNISDKARYSKVISITEVKNWKCKTLTPADVSDLIHIWREIKKCDNQIVVTCYDGVTASGLFVALAFLLEKVEAERACDVFSAVRTIKQSCMQFVQDVVQLKFLFKAAEKYLEEMEF